MNNSDVIKKGAIISYVAIFLNIAITLFYTPWMIKKIGLSDYGLYGLVYSFLSYFILDFGLSQAIQRFIAKYRAEGDDEKVSKMIGGTTRVFLIIDAVIFTILFILYFFISNIFTGLTPVETERLKGLYIIAGIFSVLSFMFKPLDGAMMAYEYFVEEKVLEMINKVGSVVCVCVALALGADVFFLILINGFFSIFTSVLRWIVFKRKSKLNIQWGYFDKLEMKGVFSFSAWSFGGHLAHRLRINLVPAVLGVLSNSTEIALFTLGMYMEGTVQILSSAINGLFLPTVSRIVQDEKRETVTDLMIRVGRVQLYIIGLVFSGFLLFGKAFLVLWVGNDFSPVYWIVLLLIVSKLVSLTQRIAEDLVYVENRIKESTLRILICSLFGLIIGCVLAPRYGAIGAAAGTAVGLCTYQVVINFFYNKRMGLEIGRFFRCCHLRILPALIILTILSYYILSGVVLDTWFNLMVGIVAYTAVFSFACFCFLFNEEEKALVLSLINPLKLRR